MIHRLQPFRSVQPERLHRTEVLYQEKQNRIHQQNQNFTQSLLKTILNQLRKKRYDCQHQHCVEWQKMVDLFLIHIEAVKGQPVLGDNRKGLALRFAFGLFIILPNTDRPPLSSISGPCACNGEYNFVTTHYIAN